MKIGAGKIGAYCVNTICKKCGFESVINIAHSCKCKYCEGELILKEKLEKPNKNSNSVLIFEKIELFDEGKMGEHDIKIWIEDYGSRTIKNFIEDFKWDFCPPARTTHEMELIKALKDLKNMYNKDQGSTSFNQQLDCFRGYSLKYLQFLSNYANKIKKGEEDGE
jgi:hypothetical protein